MAYLMVNNLGYEVTAYNEAQRVHWEGEGYVVSHTLAAEPHHALMAGLASWEIEESKGATPPSPELSFCLR